MWLEKQGKVHRVDYFTIMLIKANCTGSIQPKMQKVTTGSI